MQIKMTHIWPLAVATAIAGLTLAACGSSTPPGPVVMGGPRTRATTQLGPRMMSSASGYHFSELTCAAPTTLPGGRVQVGLGDMGMTRMMGGTAPIGAHMMLRAVPATVAAGQVTLVAANMGWRTHELVILPLAAGRSAGQRVPGPDGRIDEKGSLGEASSSCAAGAGEGIKAGAVGWITLTLPSGRYELVCNLANHYANGMHQELVVTSR